MIEIKHLNDEKKGAFEIYFDSKKAGEMTYTWAGTHRLIIDHTEVSDALRGKSAGKQLVMKAVEFAREKGVKILPLCPFAKSVFQKTPEIQDVL